MELPLSSMFFNNLVDVERDAEFLICIMKAKVSRRITYSFIHFLEDNARSVKAYASVIIALCENILNTLPEDIELRWGIASDISKLIMALYDETANSDVEIDKCVAEKCLELWDIMFEKQIGQVQYLSKQLMER